MVDKENFYNIHTDRTILRILDELDRIAIKDLYDFLQAHEVHLPYNRKDRILQDILDKTNGHYEMTIEQLKTIVSHELDRHDAVIEEYEDDEYDY